MSFILLINILTGIYSGLDGKQDMPVWLIILVGFLYPLYHIFDLMDGKHARNTGMSSPLGLLVDHGCDALTTFLFTMGLASVLKLEGALWYSIIWFMTCIPFFLCTWEEYQIDRLDFPIIHGVSEGTFVAAGFIFFTAFMGQSFWLQDVNLFDNVFPLNKVVVTSVFILSIFFCIMNFYKVFSNEKTKNKCQALSNLIVFAFSIFSMMVLIFFSKSELLEKYPKLIVYLFGFHFAKAVVFFFLYRDIYK
jgi:ethanolaminephosphotransferase